VFAHFFVMNLVLWYMGSSAAIPFLTLLALLALWFGVSVPLTFVGAFFGFRKRILEHPVRTNQIPRQIPDQSIYTQVRDELEAMCAVIHGSFTRTLLCFSPFLALSWEECCPSDASSFSCSSC
jgi:hypothetical protein